MTNAELISLLQMRPPNDRVCIALYDRIYNPPSRDNYREYWPDVVSDGPGDSTTAIMAEDTTP